MTTDNTFFTNEPNHDLYGRFNSILQSHTQFFDVLVGYFRVSGFFKLYPAMKNIEKIRILIGLDTDSFTVQIIDAANEEIRYEELSTREGRDALSSRIRKEFARSADAEEIEQGIRNFIDWIKSGKIEMRMYTKAPIHAKLYIMRKDPKESPDYAGSVITGSSNFSMAGLQNNLEFNVELKDKRDLDFALDHFEKLWADGVAVTHDIEETVEKDTWMRDDITPYILYLKTLYEYFKEELNADKESNAEIILPDGFMRLKYQTDAVMQAKKMLMAYGGVFISDVVGLGKTYIAAMLAKSLPAGKKLIICPPVLVDYWREVLMDFDVAADVESLGKLQRVIDKGAEGYSYIFIDEAHRFRNQDTQGYNLLSQICHGKKVILISATPLNNYLVDIENLIYLFQPRHDSTILPNQRDLEMYFARLNGNLKAEKGTPEYMVQLRKNSEKIRDEVLRPVMIRRTRHEIVKYYADDLKKQGLTFPKLGSPEPILYVFNDTLDGLFNFTMQTIRNFHYARYTPLLYLKNSKQYASMLVGQRNVGGFMKGILVKRLESSFYAFKKTLGRFVESYVRFIEMFKSGDVYISKKVNVYDLLDSGDDEKLLRLVDEDKVEHFKSSEFKDCFLEDLEKDLATLLQLEKKWIAIQEDPKLDKFLEELENNRNLKDKKVIVFTESMETAGYLSDALKERYGTRVVSFSGQSDNRLKLAIEKSFNPKYKNDEEDKYDYLVTTDVLSEGINLHRSNNIINYDLPWNPTRIMQRVGRINRVGTDFDQIYVYNFFPTVQSNTELPLKDRILEKLQAFHDTLGEDFKYLSDSEEVSAQRLFDTLTGELDGEEDGGNQELKYLAVIRGVRDKDMVLFETIKRLPCKIKCGKQGKKTAHTLSFIRKGAFKTFFSTSADKTEQLTFLAAMKEIAAKPDEVAVPYSKTMYYRQLAENKASFEALLMQENELAMGTPKRSGSRSSTSIIKVLQVIKKKEKRLTDDEENQLKEIIQLFNRADINDKLAKDIFAALSATKDTLEAFYTIKNSIPPSYFMTRRQTRSRVEGEKEIILSGIIKGIDE